ncbi:MAG: LuxR C-terminal-related transcriptional regulator [Phycisphaerales bacterium]
MNSGPDNLDSILRQTAKLTASIFTLPAVATPDWADRVAKRLGGLEGVHSACVLIWLGSAGSAPAALEAAGVRVGSDEASSDTATLRVRSRIEREFRLGSLVPSRAARGGAQIGRLRSASPASNGDGRGRLWQGLEVGEIVTASLLLEGVGAERVVECLVALDREHGTRVEEVQGVLRSVLPILGTRAALALGPGEAGQSPWLTDRETVVLEHLVAGLSVRLIAERIGRSPHTVHDHVKNLHRKLGASTRGELVARALGWTARGAALLSEPEERRARPSVQLESKNSAVPVRVC